MYTYCTVLFTSCKSVASENDAYFEKKVFRKEENKYFPFINDSFSEGKKKWQLPPLP